MKIILLLFVLIFLAKGDNINLNLDDEGLASGNGYIVDDNSITISGSGEYTISGYSSRVFIISGTPVTLNFDHIQISSRGAPPITIKKNCEVTINIITNNVLIDDKDNEKDGVIYMETGSKLIFTSDSEENSLYFTPFKKFGIYGEESTNLVMNNRAYIILNSGEETGFIKIGKDIIINDGNLGDENDISDKYPSLQAGGSITIKKGSFYMHSIKAEGKIYLGEENANQNENEDEDEDEDSLGIYIKTLNTGIEANEITVYSGKIIIISEKDSFSSKGDIIIRSGNLYIEAGSSETKSSPFKKAGKLAVENALILAYGTNCIGGVIDNKILSFSYFGEIKKNSELSFYLGNEIVSESTLDKDFSYMYFSFPFPSSYGNLELKIDGNKVSSFNEGTCSSNIDSDSDNSDLDSDSVSKSNSNCLNMVNSYYIYFLVYLILF